MIINGLSLFEAKPIVSMFDTKHRFAGVSHGLAEAGYDIRIKQEVRFSAKSRYGGAAGHLDGVFFRGCFTLASAFEEFDMPDHLVGVVHDKSTWARQGLSVFNTVIEPGWKGFLTLELVYHGQDELIIPAGSGIAQVLFHKVEVPASYSGKYQNQADKPIVSIFE